MPKRKLRKVVAVGLALFMAAGVDNGWALGNIAKGITVQAKSIAKAEEEKKENPANILEYDNKIEPDFGTRYIVQISRDQDFPDGYGAYVAAMDKQDTTDYIKQLNKSLKESDMEVEDMVNPVDISVSNETNENVEDTVFRQVSLLHDCRYLPSKQIEEHLSQEMFRNACAFHTFFLGVSQVPEPRKVWCHK